MSDGLPRPEDVEGIGEHKVLCILYRAVHTFMTNDLPHMRATTESTARDVSWIKLLLVGVVLAIVGSAIAMLVGG